MKILCRGLRLTKVEYRGRVSRRGRICSPPDAGGTQHDCALGSPGAHQRGVAQCGTPSLLDGMVLVFIDPIVGLSELSAPSMRRTRTFVLVA